MKRSLRMDSVQSPVIPTIGELIRNNPGTISLGQGVVNYGPPPEAISSIDHFLSEPKNHRYQMVYGIPELIDAVGEKLLRENGINADDGRRIVITAGGNMAFLNAVLAVCDAGDEVILLVPYYFNHEMALTMLDCVPVCVETDEAYRPRIDAIERAITPSTKAVVTISPNNPSGVVYSEEQLGVINELCRRRGIYHIHDESYEYFTFDDAHHSSPGASSTAVDHTISLFSLSKSYGLASWRIGWMVLPENLFDPVKKAQDTNLICPPVVSQWAAVGALSEGRSYCTSRIEPLHSVRASVLERLAAVSDVVEVPRATGAFYFLLRVDSPLTDMELVTRLIEEYRVALIPGTAFGIKGGCHLRLAYAALDEKSVVEGVGRLADGLRNICQEGAERTR